MEFTFNGISSREFNIKIKESNHLSIPKKKIELVEVQGRTDNLIIDEGCRDLDTKTYALRLDNWLNSTNGYQDLIFNDGTILKAIFVGQIDFNEIVKNFNEILLQFKAYRESDL